MKRKIKPGLGFFSYPTAWRTIQGYEAMHMIGVLLREAAAAAIEKATAEELAEAEKIVEAFNREVEGLDDVELWIHTCWGNPNMQRVIDNDSYQASFELYLHALNGDVWTVEMTDRLGTLPLWKERKAWK